MKRTLIFLAAFLTLVDAMGATARAQNAPIAPLPMQSPEVIQIPHVTANVGGNGCYRRDEAEAEQAIRIHSELMVIGLNCQNMPSIPNSAGLYNRYRMFTAKHGKLLAEYEARLIGYFLRTGSHSPDASLNTMRTLFANKVSIEAAHMRPDIFCSQYAPRIDRVANMSDSDFQKWAGTFYPNHPLTHPMCAAQ